MTFSPILVKKNANFWNFYPPFFQLLKFHLWLCGRNFGRSAKNSTKNILLPHCFTKKILTKIRPLHAFKSQKVEPPPKRALFGGRNLYVTCDNYFLRCTSIYLFSFWTTPFLKNIITKGTKLCGNTSDAKKTFMTKNIYPHQNRTIFRWCWNFPEFFATPPPFFYTCL